MTRTERQQEAVRKWIKAKGKGTLEMPTGSGKTRTALMAIKAVIKKYPNLRVLVVVPTTTLKDQWNEHIYNHELTFNAEVQVINTIVKHNWTCDMLIIDEEHRVGAPEFSKIFECVKYKLILGLTATFNRLDGKHTIIEKYCPVVDRLTLFECQANGWISNYKEYQVLIEVDNIEEYKELNKKWTEHFEFFGFSFDKAMACVGPEGWKAKLKLRDEMYGGYDENKKKEILNSINYHAVGFIRTMQQRKAFINNHPKKIEIAKKIMDCRLNHKILPF